MHACLNLCFSLKYEKLLETIIGEETLISSFILYEVLKDEYFMNEV